MKPHNRLLLGLILGLFAGIGFHYFPNTPGLEWISTQVFQPLGQIFLRLIFMVVVPMVFSALVLGAVELGKSKGFGMVAVRTLAFTLIASTLSVVIGVGLVNVLQPGKGLSEIAATITDEATQTSVANIKTQAAASKPVNQIIIDLFTRNPLESAVRAFDGEMLAFMIFTLIFGFALSMLVAEKGDRDKNVLVEVLEQVFEVSMKVIDYAMYIAPVAVFAIIFNTSLKMGLEVFRVLSVYVAVVVLGLLIQQFVVYGTLLKVFTNQKPIEFFKKCREVYLYAFSTSSSNATLPTALNTAEHKLGLTPRISRFVLTIGATANQNGTALFEGITVLFLAQVYNIDLTVSQQVVVVLMSILAGVGTAGVPGGSLPLIMILLQQVGIPPEGLGLILGVDRFLDMCRTTINVSGDLVIAALVTGKDRPAKTKKLKTKRA